jgi:hypothetical protein
MIYRDKHAMLTAGKPAVLFSSTFPTKYRIDRIQGTVDNGGSTNGE